MTALGPLNTHLETPSEGLRLHCPRSQSILTHTSALCDGERREMATVPHCRHVSIPLGGLPEDEDVQVAEFRHLRASRMTLRMVRGYIQGLQG
jgi:hypothetical protein